MRSLITCLTACILSLPAAAQQATSTGFNRPPAGVDEALRSRILQFYELEQQGRFRQAESLVCEDSKDRYYDMEKRRWTSVELIQITYEENFTRARASLALGTQMNTFSGPLPVKAPMTTLWRQEGGAWCRYIPEPSREGLPTPFGTMKPAPSGAAPAGNPFQGAPRLPASPAELAALVKVSRTSVALPASGGADEVEIANGMPGEVGLRLVAPGVPGFEASLSSTTVPAGGKSVLKLSYSPRDGAPPPPQFTVRIVAEPIGAEKFVQVEIRK